MSNLTAAKGWTRPCSENLHYIDLGHSDQRCRTDILGSKGNGQNGRLLQRQRFKFISLLQIQTSGGEVIVTNDGATILKSIQAMHPAAKMVSIYPLYLINMLLANVQVISFFSKLESTLACSSLTTPIAKAIHNFIGILALVTL